MNQDDGPLVITFGRSLSDDDQLYLRRDITRVGEVNAWVRRLSTQQFQTLLLVDEHGDIGAYANVDRSGVPWMHHVAELRVLVGEPLRGLGTARLLTEAAFRVALEMGVEKIIGQLMVEQVDAIAVFRSLGFQPEALLRDHVKDRQGGLHDLVILSCQVGSLGSKLEMYGVTAALAE
ncbi:MAG: GNAT family N-acetyltransferase [Dehalococcoidia bacterium]|nr:GNAT family N-acetyltransferase [Dehalococcoidia bacterium]MCB9485889.1 GNAT family N-acetyltransferase [Thermoflexaceae bacterium]